MGKQIAGVAQVGNHGAAAQYEHTGVENQTKRGRIMQDTEAKLRRSLGDRALNSRASIARTFRDNDVREQEIAMKTTASTRPN